MNSRRVTVSMPAETADHLASAAHAAGAASVSAYVTEAVEQRIARDRALARLDAVWGELDPSALEWARTALRGDGVSAASVGASDPSADPTVDPTDGAQP